MRKNTGLVRTRPTKASKMISCLYLWVENVYQTRMHVRVVGSLQNEPLHKANLNIATSKV